MATKLLRSLSSDNTKPGKPSFLRRSTNGALRRPKPSTARRRQSEFNVFGDGDLVSVDFLLQNIKAAEKNKGLTKLELEDLVNGNDMRDVVVSKAVQSMLKNDGGRSWVFIKFMDSVRVGVFGDGVEELKDYERKRRALWDHIKEEAATKPIMFSLKLEIEEDTPASTIIQIFNELQEYNLARIEYMGGLYGYKAPEIGEALAELCRPEDPDLSIKEDGVLKEMVMLTLHYATGDNETSNSGGRDRIWKKVLRRCVKRLGGHVTAISLGDSEHGLGVKRTRSRSRSKSPVPGLKDSEHSSKSASGRSRSPRRNPSDTNLMRMAIAANRAKSPKRVSSSPSMPTLGRAASEGTPPPTSPKRRKARSFALAIPEHDDLFDDDTENSFTDDFGNNSNNLLDESKEDNKTEDKTPTKHLRRRQGVARSASSPMQKRDPVVESPNEDKEEVKRSSSMEKKPRPIRRRQGVVRCLSSPMRKRDPIVESPNEDKKEVKRSSSMEKKLRPKNSTEKKDEDQQEMNKSPRRSTRKVRPSYDWSTHSSEHKRNSKGDMDWGCCSTDTRNDIDGSQACAAKTA